jgi:hypothetical protein
MAKPNLVLREGVKCISLSKRVENVCKDINVEDLLFEKKEAEKKKETEEAANRAAEANRTTSNVADKSSTGADAEISMRDAAYAARDAALINRIDKQIRAAFNSTWSSGRACRAMGRMQAQQLCLR